LRCAVQAADHSLLLLLLLLLRSTAILPMSSRQRLKVYWPLAKKHAANPSGNNCRGYPWHAAAAAAAAHLLRASWNSRTTLSFMPTAMSNIVTMQ
jgi:hypothetical protein